MSSLSTANLAIAHPERKTDSQSVLSSTLQHIIENKPDPLATAPPVIQKWINSGWLFFRRGQHEAFLVAWHVGEVLSAVRRSCPHGNRRNRTGPTWPEWVSRYAPFCIETANRWADMFEIIKPETATNFDHLTIDPARKMVEMFRGEQRRHEKRNAIPEPESNDKEPAGKEPPPIGNAINNVRNWSGKLAESLEFHGVYSSHQSPLRDGDKLKSWIADGLLCAGEILAATETMNEHLQSSESRPLEWGPFNMFRLDGKFAESVHRRRSLHDVDKFSYAGSDQSSNILESIAAT